MKGEKPRREERTSRGEGDGHSIFLRAFEELLGFKLLGAVFFPGGKNIWDSEI